MIQTTDKPVLFRHGLKHLKLRLFAFIVIAFVAAPSFLYLKTPIQTQQVSAATGINEQISFQGKLVNTNGTNVTDGNYTIVFSIYTVASGGVAVWTETQNPVAVSNGIFQVELGSVTTLPGSVDFNTDNIYLGIKVGADAEMTPRIRFGAVPQAFNADRLDGLDSTGFILNTTSQQSGANFNISGTGVIGTSLTTPLLQNAGTLAISATGANQIQFSTNGSIEWSILSGGEFEGNGASVLRSSTGNITIASNGGNGNVILSPNGSGDVTVSTDADTNFQLTATAAPGVDQLAITNAGQAVTTAGVNAFSINYVGGSAAVESSAQRIDLQPGGTTGGTWSAVRLVHNATGPATGVISNGVKLEGPTTGGAGTYNAINIANIGAVTTGGTVRGINITGTNSQVAGTVRGIQLNNLTAGAASEIGIDLGTGWDNLMTYNNGATVLVNGTGQWNLAQVTGTLGLGNGGTNATTSQGAINNISQLTTNGDLLYHNGTNSTRLARGANGECLTSNTTTIVWGSCSSGSTLQAAYTADADGSDAVIALTSTDGAVIIRDNATPLASTLFAVQNSAGTTNYLQVTTGTTTAVNASGSTSVANTNVHTFTTSVTATTGLINSGFRTTTTMDFASAASQSIFGIAGNLTYSASNAQNYTGNGIGILGSLDWRGTGNSTGSRLDGVRGIVQSFAGATGTLENVAAVSGGLTLNGVSSVTTAQGFLFNDPGGTSAITTLYGIRIGSLTRGTTNYAILTEGTTQSSFGGNVGIGTTGPNAKLSVTGGDSFINFGELTGPTQFSGIAFGQSSASITTGNYSLLGEGTHTYLNRPTSGNIYFRENNTDQMTLLTGGNLGIGDTSPDAKLEVLATTEQLRLTHTDGTVDARFTVDGSGNLTIDNTGTKTVVADDLQVTGNDILDSGANTRLTLGATSTFTGNLSINSSGTFSSGTGIVTLQGNTNIAGTVSFATQKGTDYTTAGSANNVAISTASLYRLDTSGAAQTITGIVAGRDGQFLTLMNTDTSLAVTLSNNSASSSDGNKIITGTGSDISIPAGASIDLMYDSTGVAATSFWRVVGAVAGGTGCPTCANQALSNLSSVNIGTTALNSTSNNLNLTTTTSGDIILNSANNIQLQDNTNVTGNLDVSAAILAGTGDAFQVSSAGAISTSATGTALTLSGAATTAINISNTGVTTDINLQNSEVIHNNVDGDITFTRSDANSDTITIRPATGAASIAGILTTSDLTTSAKTWTLPNASGTIAVSASGNIALSALGDITFTGTLGATNGGTGQNTYAVGDLLYASTTSALSRLAAVATGSCLISQGVSTAPVWGSCGASNTLQGVYNNDVDGSDAIIALTTADDSIIIRNPAASGTDSTFLATFEQLNTGAKDLLVLTQAGTGYALRVNDDGTATDSTPFVIDQSGNVGIGTTSAGAALDVVDGSGGNVMDIQSTSATGWSSIDILNSGGTAVGGIGYGNASASTWANTTYLTSRNSTDLLLGSNNTEVVRITNAGNVGIGASSPTSFKLQVAGHIGPNADDTYDLGSDSLRFRDVYVGGETIHIGDSTSDEGAISYNQTTDTLSLKTATNSTTAFQVQNAAGGALFNIDSTPDADNLVTNGGFEANTTGWTAKTGGTLTQTTAQRFYGLGSMSIATTATAGAGARFDVPLAASTFHILTMMVKTSASVSTLEIGYSNTGTDVSCATGQSATNTEWKQLSCFFTTAGTVSGTRYIYIKQTDATARTIYIDNVLLDASGGGIINSGDANFHINGTIVSPLNIQNEVDSTLALVVRQADGTALFNVDTDTGCVGVGGGCTTGPRDLVVTDATGNGRADIGLLHYDATSANSGQLIFSRSAGNALSPGNVATGYDLGNIYFQGMGGGAFRNGARIVAQIDSGTVSGTSMPTELIFQTTPDGSTTPVTHLTINENGTINTSGFIITGSTVFSGGDVTAAGRHFYSDATSVGTNTSVCRTATAGLFGFTTGHCSSLQKYKDNTTNLSLGIETLRQLRPVEFDWNIPGGGGHDLGFIAEEVNAINPLLAEYSNGQLSGVKYNLLTSLITKSVQQLDVQVQSQSNKINLASQVNSTQTSSILGLNNRLDNVESELSILQDQMTNGLFGTLNVSGMATFQSLVVLTDANVEGTLTAGTLVVKEKITVEGHIYSHGEAPEIEAQPNLGVLSASVSLDGTDTAGTLTLVAGNTPATGVLAKITFNKEYEKPPRIVLSAINEDGLSLPVFARKVADGFEIVTTGTPVTGKSYQFDYVIIGSDVATQ